jgi:hypothetical protein
MGFQSGNALLQMVDLCRSAQRLCRDWRRDAAAIGNFARRGM